MNQAHLHLLLNHIPILGTAIGCLFLGYALLRKNDEFIKASLVFMVLIAVLALAAYLTGEPAEKVVEHLPGVTEALIESHEDAGKFALITAGLTGVASLAALFLSSRVKILPVIVLALALLTTGMMAWVGNLGGQIRHTEIRTGGGQSIGAENTQSGTATEKKKERDDD